MTTEVGLSERSVSKLTKLSDESRKEPIVENAGIENSLVTRWSAYDLAVYLSILLFGSLQFVFYDHTNHFAGGAATYELARSLLEKGSYGYLSRPETMLPPGLPALVALVWTCLGNSYPVFMRIVPLFATLFLITSYELLRRNVGRGPAAAITLLVGSSPFFFSFSTRLLFPDIPFAFTTTLALLVASRLDSSTARRARAGLWLAFTTLLAYSLLLRTAALAMLAALAAWLTISVFAAPTRWRARLKTFLPSLTIGIATLGLWLAWARNHEQLQWPSIKTHPGSYLSQLFLKEGKDPDLGAATLADIPARVAVNTVEGSASLLRIGLRRWVEPTWNSPLILGCVLLILLGLRASNWADSSGLIHWYFISCAMMYILWPWEIDQRYVLSTAPLAFMYLWRGYVYLASKRDVAAPFLGRHRIGITIVPLVLSILMAVYSASLFAQHKQGKQTTIFWLFLAACFSCAPWVKNRLTWLMSSLHISNPRQTLPAILVVGVIAIGLLLQLRLAIGNLDADLTKLPSYPEIEAAQWIKSHTDSDAVVMAFGEGMVQHYSGRRVIMLPRSRDTQTFLSGIIRHGVEWIIVVDGVDRWVGPRDDECFNPLARAYPDAFELVHQGPRNRVFRVTRKLPELTRESADASPPDHVDRRRDVTGQPSG
jgi:hypothetical protein